MRTFSSILLLAVLTTACSGSDVPTTGDTVATNANSSEPDDLETYCDELTRLDVERPESYNGSTEQVADIDGLLAVAPDPVREDVSTLRDYLASGAIDSEADPDSNLIENWPDEVQAATAGLQAFGAENC